jgi:hypothetical protein
VLGGVGPVRSALAGMGLASQGNWPSWTAPPTLPCPVADHGCSSRLSAERSTAAGHHEIDALAAAVRASPAQLNQRHVAAAIGDQRLQIRVPVAQAAPARQQDRDIARLERRAWRRQLVRVCPAIRHQRPSTSSGLRTRRRVGAAGRSGAFTSPTTTVVAAGRRGFSSGTALAAAWATSRTSGQVTVPPTTARGQAGRW